MLLQDGSMALTVLDMTTCPAKQIRRTKASTWFRLQRIAETTSTAFVLMTPEPVVSNADERITLERRFTLESLETMRDLLEERLLPKTLGEAGQDEWEKIAKSQAHGGNE